MTPGARYICDGEYDMAMARRRRWSKVAACVAFGLLVGWILLGWLL